MNLLRSEIKCRGQKYCENKLCEMRNEFAEIRNKMQRSEILLKKKLCEIRNELLRSEIKCRGQKYCENKLCEIRNELLRSEIKC